jgi:hypothetical protein
VGAILNGLQQQVIWAKVAAVLGALISPTAMLGLIDKQEWQECTKIAFGQDENYDAEVEKVLLRKTANPMIVYDSISSA